MPEVRKARFCGACYGVQRALDLAMKAAEAGGEVSSLGSLIHNPVVVRQLEESGVRVADSIDEIAGGKAIIRSHGVGPSTRKALEASADEVVDATCPHVFRAQKAAAELGERWGTVLVVGDARHPEVDGLRAYAEEAGGTAIVVGSAEDVPEDLPAKVGVVVQTTQSRELLGSVMAVLAQRSVEVELRDTICAATAKRQQAAAELAGQVDAIVVIGGHNSSNTTRLFEICKSVCPRTVHIETLDELEGDFLAGCRTVGVTAGASTPEDQIAEVVDYLRRQ